MTPPPALPAKLEHFIGGALVPSADGATFEVADPVTNQPYATVAAGAAEDINRAVAAATIAFRDGPWPDLPGRERARILNKIADGIEGRAARIAELETFDTGLPVTQARGQAARAAENFRFFADNRLRMDRTRDCSSLVTSSFLSRTASSCGVVI